MLYLIIQDPTSAIEGFRGDPVLYALLFILIGAVVALGRVYLKQRDHADGLLADERAKNDQLQKSLLDLVAQTTEAITTQNEVIRGFKDQRMKGDETTITHLRRVMGHLQHIEQKIAEVTQ